MNANAWSVLGIAPTDDARAIKRAYSARLKACRPEDDAEGFARLRAAYEMLLARAEHLAKQRAQSAQSHAAEMGADVSTSAPPLSVPHSVESPSSAEEITCVPTAPKPPTSPPASRSVITVPPLTAVPLFQAATPAPAVHTPQALAAEIIAQANVFSRERWLTSHDPQAFAQWLAAYPALISLQTKQETAHALLAALARDATVPASALRTLHNFFGWDDPLEQRRLARAGLGLDAVAAQMERIELQQWMAAALARKDALARRLERIRHAGDHGARLWWLVLTHMERFRPLITLNQVLKQHSYRAVEHYVGTPAMRFWQDMYASVPNRAQWLRAIGQPLLFGVLCLLVAPFLCQWVSPNTSLNWPAVFETAATCTLLPLTWNCARLAGRWLRFGMPPVWREWLARSRRWLGFAPVSWRLLLLSAALLVPAWYWPASWPIWPYAGALGALLLLQARTWLAFVVAALAVVSGLAILGLMLAERQAQALAYWLTLPMACLANYVYAAQAKRPARVANSPRISWRALLAISWLLSILFRALWH